MEGYINFITIKVVNGAARGGGARASPYRMSGAHRAGIFTFFLQNFPKTTFYHICKMKWPKSDEKVKIGGS